MKLTKQDVLDGILIFSKISHEKVEDQDLTVIIRPDFASNHKVPRIPFNFSPHKISISISKNRVGVWLISDHQSEEPSYYITNLFTGDAVPKIVQQRTSKSEKTEEPAVEPEKPKEQVKEPEKPKKPITTPPVDFE